MLSVSNGIDRVIEVGRTSSLVFGIHGSDVHRGEGPDPSIFHVAA